MLKNTQNEKRTSLLTIAFLLVVFSSFSQKSPIKFGDIPMEDLTMKSYDQDTSASAIILVNYGEATYKTFECHVRIKILRRDGFKWGDVRIVVSSNQHVTKLKAATYNLEEGKIIPSEMNDRGVFKNNITEGINLETFTLPNIKVGSVIEYSYTVVATYGMYPPEWVFQKSIPVRYSEYWAIIPDVFQFRRSTQGYVQEIEYNQELKQMTGYEANAHHWIGRNIPAFHAEPYITSETNYLSKIRFDLVSVALTKNGFTNTIEVMMSWDKLAILKIEFDKLLGVVDFTKEEISSALAQAKDSLQKVIAVHDYVRDRQKWNEHSAAVSKQSSLKKAWETKSGSSADTNFLLGSLLKQAGFDVKMVLYSTRDHGYIRKEVPMVKQFNDVLCSVKINGSVLLLDATEQYLPYNILPFRSLNGEGLVINKEVEWIDISSRVKAKTTTSTDISIATNGEVKGKVNLIYGGYDASRMKKNFYEKGQEKYTRDFLSSKDWQIEKPEFQNLITHDKPVTETFDFVATSATSVANDIIYVNPLILSQVKENPFVAETREYPIDYGNPRETLYVGKITLPDDYIVDEVPPNSIFGLPGNAARYVYSITPVGNALTITRTLQINKILFVQDEYPQLREFYEKVLAKEAEQVVLKRKQK